MSAGQIVLCISVVSLMISCFSLGIVLSTRLATASLREAARRMDTLAVGLDARVQTLAEDVTVHLDRMRS